MLQWSLKSLWVCEPQCTCAIFGDAAVTVQFSIEHLYIVLTYFGDSV